MNVGRLGRRALWDLATPTTTHRHFCTAFALPSNGVISINPTLTIRLTKNAVFTPECTGLADGSAVGYSSIEDLRDPFHASITPQAYVTGAATLIAWMLVIMLLITPRTFFVAGSVPRTGLLGRRGMIGGATGGASVIGVGSRPWLQKAAALTVAVSLTIATADTFKVAQRQYEAGYMDAFALRQEVVGGMELKVSRIVSDVFLWLAQVQTLIRLFPRHKEKVIIKWTGFALIILDMIFSCLDTFMSVHVTAVHPRKFVDAIPALSYLFQLALSMLYAAWVIYYAFTKRRYAFYHSMMWNISLVAIFSIVAILTPVVFFITDISNSSVAGWGDYFRWTGAAAASVIVWEWVERIEALEREEKKDGILGREIFDGDEMLEANPSEEIDWPRNRHGHHGHGGSGGEDGAYSSGAYGHRPGGMAHLVGRTRSVRQENHPIVVPLGQTHTGLDDPDRLGSEVATAPSPAFPAIVPPPAVASPVSRTDTSSAASTIYAIRYHTIEDSLPPPVQQPAVSRVPEISSIGSEDFRPSTAGRKPTDLSDSSRDLEKNDDYPAEEPSSTVWKRIGWSGLPNLFRRKPLSPPAEVRGARVIESSHRGPRSPAQQPSHHSPRWALKSRLGAFAAEQGERFREKATRPPECDDGLPVTIIPAQRHGRTWSPQSSNEQNTASGEAPPAGAALPDDAATHGETAPSPAPQAGEYQSLEHSHSLDRDAAVELGRPVFRPLLAESAERGRPDPESPGPFPSPLPPLSPFPPLTAEPGTLSTSPSTAPVLHAASGSPPPNAAAQSPAPHADGARVHDRDG